MTTTQINLSVDSSLKADVDKIFAAIGLTTTEALRMFLRQTAVKRRLPLSVAERDVSFDQLPLLELSEEGYRRLALAINNTDHSEAILNQHKQDYERFVKEHHIGVRQ